MDGIEADLEGQADVLRLDILSDVGGEAMETYEVKAVPTILVFDGEGQVLFRQVGKPDADAIRWTVADWYANR